MNLTGKLLTIAVVTTSLFSLTNAPAHSKNMKMAKMTMSTEAMNMAMMTMDNNKNMMMTGMKMIAEGNKAGDADKMIMGAKMMRMSMDTMHMGMMHMKMMDKKSHDAMMSKMNMTPKMMTEMKTALSENASMLMNMGNKMMKDAGTDSEKMMKGSKMVQMGMHMIGMSMMNGKMDENHHAEMHHDM